MAHSPNNGSHNSDDPDSIVYQLLRQFQNSTNPRTPPAASQTTGQEIQMSPAPDSAAVTQMAPFAIHVPTVSNPEDYEYLPGHFVVREVLEVSDSPTELTYTVRLQSGERETMPFSRLIGLENGAQALEALEEDSDSSDDIQVVGPRRRFIDGAASATLKRRRRAAAQSDHYTPFYDTFDSDSEETSDDSGLRTRVRRSTRRKDTPFYDTFDGDSEETSDDNGLRTRVRRSTRHKDIRGVRTSTRQKKALRKSLHELLEDDLSDEEGVVQRRQKFSGAREVFRKLSQEDDFRQWHCNNCDVCNIYDDTAEKGPLVFCQGCTSSYHQACLGPRAKREHLVTKIDQDDFILQCRRCVGFAHERDYACPHLGCCAVCKEEGPMSQPLRERMTSREEQQQRVTNGGTDPVTLVDMSRVNNTDNLLFRCTSCQRAFHVQHLSTTTAQDRADVFAEFSLHWLCKECQNSPGDIDTIIAWRLVNSQVKLAEIIPEIDKEYLIKWKKMSYFRATWMPGDWLWGRSSGKLRGFFNSPKSRKPIMTAKEAIPEEYLRIDIVFDVVYFKEAVMPDDETNPEMVERAYVKYKGLTYEDAVWESPPNPSETARWNDFKIAFDDWVYRDTIHLPKPSTLRDHLAEVRTQNFETSLVLNSPPDLMNGGELMGFQMDGVNWLYYMFLKQKNAILADDMGLGKTIQVIGLFATLIERHGCWPFLVVAPNSTVQNWRREIKLWAPKIRVVTYFGSATARQMAREYEMFPEGSKDLRCHVVIASYESMLDEEVKRLLSRINWAGLVVDEGQRLKNDKTQLYDRLCRMKFNFKALLTGTPLQNNIRELFNLIQFLDPNRRAEDLEEEYGALTAENIRDLHDMIRPFFLRRTKSEVLPFLPPVAQIIIPVSMSVVQKKLYKSILEKNPQLIKAICIKDMSQLKKYERYNLNNILMQLRKCLCHPFIYNRDIEDRSFDPVVAHRQLVEASGKLQLLNLMLPKLRDRGHRVLIFSQFLQNLDIVEDFLDGLGLRYRRLDGHLSSLQKQIQIDEFNAPDSPYFAFLLSTRSGGVGINLASADTVIIMDPDFNPKQDMQALSRAHRIGQSNTVLVFHLVTRSSVEEKIMQKGKKKLALDHVLIERMEANEDEEDLESILRHGAESVFQDDESAEVQDLRYDAESIDKLLDRSQAEQEKKKAEDAPTATTDQPRFNFARVWQNDRGTLEEVTETEDRPVDINLWDRILQDRERAAAEEAHRKAEGLGRGKRKRAVVNYQTGDEAVELDHTVSSPLRIQSRADSDAEFQQEDGGDDEDNSESLAPVDVAADAVDLDGLDVGPDVLQPLPKIRPFKRVESPPLKRSMGTDGTTDHQPACIACEHHHQPGCCPLRLAGVENCPMCGLAHYGKNRSCAHLQSEVQVHRMLDALCKSNESPELINLAKKYLRGVLGHLQARSRRVQEAAENGPQIQAPLAFAPQKARPAQPVPTTASQHFAPRPNVIDLTESDTPSDPPETSRYFPVLQQGPPLNSQNFNPGRTQGA